MIDFAVTVLVGIVFVIGAIVLVLGSYFIARRILHQGSEGDRTSEAAGAVAVRIAALHGILLGLVYAQELDDYKGVRSALQEEAVAISDIFNDARRYGAEIMVPVQGEMAAYLVNVVDQEWSKLGRREGLSAPAWVHWQNIYERMLDVVPVNERQVFLRERILERTTAIARFRQLREAASFGGFSGLFWTPALLGLCLVAIPFYVYRPTRTHIVLLSSFGAYSGIVLFFIFAFGNPFMEPGKLEPVAFTHLLDSDIGKSLEPPPR